MWKHEIATAGFDGASPNTPGCKEPKRLSLSLYRSPIYFLRHLSMHVFSLLLFLLYACWWCVCFCFSLSVYFLFLLYNSVFYCCLLVLFSNVQKKNEVYITSFNYHHSPIFLLGIQNWTSLPTQFSKSFQLPIDSLRWLEMGFKMGFIFF